MLLSLMSRSILFANVKVNTICTCQGQYYLYMFSLIYTCIYYPCITPFMKKTKKHILIYQPEMNISLDNILTTPIEMGEHSCEFTELSLKHKE